MPSNSNDALELIQDETNTNINLKGISYSFDTMEENNEDEKMSQYDYFLDSYSKQLDHTKNN